MPLSIVDSWASATGATGATGGETGRAHAATPRARSAAAVVLLALLTGCASRSLVTRAIRARGGPVESFVRVSEARVHVGFPGDWSWRTAFLFPDRYAWRIFTAGEPDDYLFDGTVARAFVAGRQVAEEAGVTSALRTHARFVAVTNLDALLLPGVQIAPLSRAELPPGAVEGIAVVLADDGSQYRLAFDARTLLVQAEGPLALPPLGSDRVVVRFGDYRPTGGRLIARRMDYTFAGNPLASEDALAVCVAPRGLALPAFQSPDAPGVPPCGTGAPAGGM